MMDNEPLDENTILRALESLAGCEHVSAQYVRFRRDVFRAQVRTYHRLHEPGGQALVPVNSTGINGASAVLDWARLSLDASLAGELSHNLMDVLRNTEHGSQDLSRLAEIADDPDLVIEFVRAAAVGPDEAFLALLAQPVPTDVAGPLFFGRVLCAPIATYAVEILRQQDVVVSDSGDMCGWCGSHPGLARLTRDGGKRILVCSLCAHHWEFSRMDCPFCGRSGTLEKLSFESGDPCSIEACAVCHGYLKTIDERRLEEEDVIIPLVTSIATLYLDLIAERKALTQALPYVAIR